MKNSIKKIEAKRLLMNDAWQARKRRGRSQLTCPCVPLGKQAAGMGGIFYIFILLLFLPFLPDCVRQAGGEGRWGFIYSQSGWFQQSPLPTANGLSSVKFVNNTTGFICGGNTILKTTNSGQLWQIIDTATNYILNSIDFFDENTGIAVGANSNGTGIILRTTNGGNNWLQIPTNRYLSQVNCTINNIAFITCDSSYLLKSTNRGLNWNQISSINKSTLLSLSFIDDHTGYVIGWLNLIYKTTDGGQSWTQQISNSQSLHLNSIFFVNANLGYIAGGFGSSEIQKTTDGGSNWYLQNITYGSLLNSINFINIKTGYAVGRDGTILKTTSGGDLWFFQYSYLTNNEWLFDIFTLNPDTVYLVGGPGMISMTTDGGNNWLSQFSGSVYDLNSICFANLNTGYAIGNGPIMRELIKTTNGGINWLYQNFPPGDLKQKRRDMDIPGSGQKVYFLDSNLGFILEGYTIFKTIDGGNNWLNYTFPDTLDFYDFNFINNLTGYITGHDTYKTTNGGINWFILNDTSGYIYRYAINFINDIGYIAGENGLILKTTNGGINWISQNSGISDDIYSIYLNNANTGYVCGVNNILKTTNGGNNWLSIYNGEGSIFTSIYFVNINTGYCVGDLFYGILETTNSGNNWFTTVSNYGQLSSIFFINDSIGWVAGYDGTIVKTTTGGNPIAIKLISNKIPKNFILYQNYPNPFNPSTKIKFFIPKKIFVTLKIYNILGQEVTTIVNKELSTGLYEIVWNGSNYSSGVYFYQLKTKEFEESKKFVLLK